MLFFLDNSPFRLLNDKFITTLNGILVVVKFVDKVETVNSNNVSQWLSIIEVREENVRFAGKVEAGKS